MAASTILGRFGADAGRAAGAARFFGGRIALEMRPGAEAGLNEAVALFAAIGDSSSGSSCILASLGIDSSVITSADASTLGAR